MTSSKSEQLQKHKDWRTNFRPFEARPCELESDKILEKPGEQNEVHGPKQLVHRLQVLQIHSKNHDEAEISVEDVRTEEDEKKAEPVDGRLCAWICLAAKNIVVGSVMLLVDQKESRVAVDGQCEENRECEE